MIDVTHDGDDRRSGPQIFLVIIFVTKQFLELHLLLLAGIDQEDLGTDLHREELDHVIGQRLRGGYQFAFLEQVAHDVGRGAVELGTEILRGGTALDDDFPLGYRRIAA